jgi:hypothetical protein
MATVPTITLVFAGYCRPGVLVPILDVRHRRMLTSQPYVNRS